MRITEIQISHIESIAETTIATREMIKTHYDAIKESLTIADRMRKAIEMTEVVSICSSLILQYGKFKRNETFTAKQMFRYNETFDSLCNAYTKFIGSEVSE